ncbi:MAG TPA: hypothetical protein VFE03_01800 [Caulobacteraceae bacterium]|jgi:hypothetical protein|nr:hypothetical protein [Caulobacteraceae bacterium]
MRLTCLALAAAWSALLVGAAAAEPEAPTLCPLPLSPPAESLRPHLVGSRPAPPPCVNVQKHTHTCRHGELVRYNAAMDSFNAQIDGWNERARIYVDALNHWTQSVTNYSRCELDALNAETAKSN